jgi:hypothetical protein
VRALALAALLLLAGGCVYFPSIEDIGGTRITPVNGRAVRRADGAAVYLELNSTGKFGDVVTGVSAAVARQARLVGGDGQALARFEVPGAATVALKPGGPHVVLSGLTRPLVAGETIIVTLMLEKSGGLGVVTVVE